MTSKTRSLAVSYMSVCLVAQKILKSEAWILLIVVAGCTIRLMTTVYTALKFNKESIGSVYFFYISGHYIWSSNVDNHLITYGFDYHYNNINLSFLSSSPKYKYQ